jgi:hypothetical protein
VVVITGLVLGFFLCKRGVEMIVGFERGPSGQVVMGFNQLHKVLSTKWSREGESSQDYRGLCVEIVVVVSFDVAKCE